MLHPALHKVVAIRVVGAAVTMYCARCMDYLKTFIATVLIKWQKATVGDGARIRWLRTKVQLALWIGEAWLHEH